MGKSVAEQYVLNPMQRILDTIWKFFFKDAQAKDLFHDTSHDSDVSHYGMDQESLPNLKTDGNQESLKEVSLL